MYFDWDPGVVNPVIEAPVVGTPVVNASLVDVNAPIDTIIVEAPVVYSEVVCAFRDVSSVPEGKSEELRGTGVMDDGALKVGMTAGDGVYRDCLSYCSSTGCSTSWLRDTSRNMSLGLPSCLSNGVAKTELNNVLNGVFRDEESSSRDGTSRGDNNGLSKDGTYSVPGPLRDSSFGAFNGSAPTGNVLRDGT